MNTTELLSQVQHRPWPLPERPWIMTQQWDKLLFAHWPVPAEVVQPFIPKPLRLDTYDDQAWIGVVPFEMSYTLRGIPWTSRFRELNVRTYVHYQDKPGVFFFSLDATDWLAVQAARFTYALPYYQANMTINSDHTTIHYQSYRTHANCRPAAFQASYQPTSSVFHAQPGSLDHWLTERYCLYVVNHFQRLCRGDIHHLPWPLQHAEADIRENTMSELALPAIQPILHYAHHLDVIVWPLVSLAESKR